MRPVIARAAAAFFRETEEFGNHRKLMGRGRERIP